MIFKYNSGYALLEVLVALFISSSLVALAMRYQTQLVAKSAEQFQHLSEINQLRNEAEHKV
jgi:prepilin-type N-terminal cleavage/methylation domain-containing protein